MSDYTPTTDEVREVFRYDCLHERLMLKEQADEAFDRWYSAEKAKWIAEGRADQRSDDAEEILYPLYRRGEMTMDEYDHALQEARERR